MSDNERDNENHNPWTTRTTETRYENPWIRVEHNTVLNPAGNEGIYGVIRFKNVAVGIIPVDNEGNIWMVGQYRYPLGRYSWEIPEGGCPLGTPTLESAKRELLEEVGLRAKRWDRLLHIDLSNSVCDEVGEIWLARELEFTQSEPEETEVLQLLKLPLETVYQGVLAGKFRDSMTVAGILRLKLMMQETPAG